MQLKHWIVAGATALSLSLAGTAAYAGAAPSAVAGVEKQAAAQEAGALTHVWFRRGWGWGWGGGPWGGCGPYYPYCGGYGWYGGPGWYGGGWRGGWGHGGWGHGGWGHGGWGHGGMGHHH